ncbi:MAG TPA: G1 family glutamic endopeptidase [Thermoplasmata archaeon]|nr:G1 family glutamic endopeptidase [Thermoplasmata archaeon]
MTVTNAVAAGYVVRSNASFTQVTGNWTLPQLNASLPVWSVNLWIGLGGFRAWTANNLAVDPFGHGSVRVGTMLTNSRSWCGCRGGFITVVFYVVVNGSYSWLLVGTGIPGNQIAASIRYQPSNGQLFAQIADQTWGSVYSLSTNDSGAHFHSAEWVLSECAEICGAPLQTLAPIHFHYARAEVGTQLRSIAGWGTPIRLKLLDPGAGTPVDATTSALWSHGAAFAVLWKSS